MEGPSSSVMELWLISSSSKVERCCRKVVRVILLWERSSVVSALEDMNRLAEILLMLLWLNSSVLN